MIYTLTVEGAPEYPDYITIEDKTAKNSGLVGVYRRQGEERVWKYRDYELSFNGEYLVDSFNIRSMISIMKESSGVSLETVEAANVKFDFENCIDMQNCFNTKRIQVDGETGFCNVSAQFQPFCLYGSRLFL